MKNKKIIKDVRNRYIRNAFRLEKENKAIKDIILRDIRNCSENKEEEKYYKSVKVSNFCSINFNEYESNGDRKKTILVEEHLNKIRPFLKDINNIKKSDTWKIQLTVAKKFIPSIHSDEECIMYWKSDKIEK